MVDVTSEALIHSGWHLHVAIELNVITRGIVCGLSGTCANRTMTVGGGVRGNWPGRLL
jgi:hypothetical protein